ncbi:MAG: VTT domain-containing protein [Desulfovibrionales bacterium]
MISLLNPGTNCWRTEQAGRATVLVDGKDYFSAFYHAACNAEKYILISGWEMDSRVALLRDGTPPDGLPVRFGPFLNRLAVLKPDLEIFILAWDYSMIFIMEREPLPVLHLGWNTHHRVHFHLDDEHPIGASHHQKIVVVDGKVAFTGGLDLTKRRWDTPEHRPGDSRRTDPSGMKYPPFHDVQVMVEGDCACGIQKIFENRWLRATGTPLSLPQDVPSDPWPDGFAPDFTNVEFGIARTDPSFKGRPAIREIERLYLDAIEHAEHFIYMENQYFSSPIIRNALARSLLKEKGPRIIFVLPERSTGWLEETTLDSLRNKNILMLRENDPHERLGIYYPWISGLDDNYIKVHSKVFIADDDFLTIGSANLSNRSMGLDTELNLALEAKGNQYVSAAIRKTRNRLLGEHLGVPAEELEEKGIESILRLIDKRAEASRTLRTFSDVMVRKTQYFPVNPELLDPEKPTPFDQFMDGFVPEEKEDGFKGHTRLIKIGVTACILLLLAAMWRWTPLSEYVQIETLTGWKSFLQEYSALAPFIVIGAFVVGGLLMFPVTVLIAATAVVFSPPGSIFYSFAGSFLSAVVVYFIGRRLSSNTVRHLTGNWLSKLSRLLSQRGRGLATITVIRMLPIAPFTIINLAAGAVHIRFWQYALGTLLGMTPGILGVSVFTDRLIQFVQRPDIVNFLILLIVSAFIVLTGIWIKKRLSR